MPIVIVDVQLGAASVRDIGALRRRRRSRSRWRHGQSAGRDEVREISAVRLQLHLLGEAARLSILKSLSSK